MLSSKLLQHCSGSTARAPRSSTRRWGPRRARGCTRVGPRAARRWCCTPCDGRRRRRRRRPVHHEQLIGLPDDHHRDRGDLPRWVPGHLAADASPWGASAGAPTAPLLRWTTTWRCLR